MKTNCVSFTGKKEILYGLTKASQEAKEAEIKRLVSSGPRAVNRSDEHKKHIAVMNAYVDMIVNDCQFKETVTNFEKSRNIKQISENLGYLHAFDVLKRAITNKVSKFKNLKDVQLDNLWNGLKR